MAGAAASGGALNQAGAAQAGTSSFGGQAGTPLFESGGSGATAGGGSGGVGHGGASGSAGVANSGGLGGWNGSAGSAGAAGTGGAGTIGNGEYCAPCVTSTDCATGSYCVGGVNPRCGKACTTDADCTVGTATSTCAPVSIGGGAATPVGGGATPSRGGAAAPIGNESCTPADDVCGTALTSAVLTCNDTWANYAQNFFATTCIGSCHRHDQTFPTVTAVRGLADAIRSEVETGAMPAGTPLPQADRLRLLTWLACGAP
jgi:hypothetical protein